MCYNHTMNLARGDCVDIKDIRYFVAVAQEHSMSKASQSLFVSQPMLSQTVKKLESEFGTQLFLRKGNTLSLTMAGDHFLKMGLKLLAEHDSLAADMRMLSVSDKEETVRFGISSFYSRQYLPELFLHYINNLPNVRLTPVENGSYHLERMVLGGELDFCFVPSTPEREGLVYRTIDIEEFLLAVPRDHPANQFAVPSTGRPYMEFTHVMDSPFILHYQGSKSWVMCERLFNHYGFTPKVVFETVNRETMYALTSLGIGVCILPEMMSRMHLRQKAPNFYRIADVKMTRSYAVAYRPQTKLTPAQEHLIDVMTRLIMQWKSEP